MISLALVALFLPLSHFLIASTRLRRLLVGRFGEQRYLASYSTLTLVTLAGRGRDRAMADRVGPWRVSGHACL